MNPQRRTAMPDEAKKASFTPQWLLFAIFGALLAVLAALLVLIFKPAGAPPKTLAGMSDAERAAFAQTMRDEVAKHIILTDEVPAVTLADDNLEVLRAQGGFWQNVMKGDYILVFSQDPRVVVWRPAEKLIVNVGPIINDMAEEEDMPWDSMDPIFPIE